LSKTLRIIQLINLLNTRRSVTVKTIKEACQIPERTAYRYLNTISEANIPVYFDRNIQAYRLNTDANLAINDLSFGESVLAVVALKALAAVAGQGYQHEIGQLITKVLVRQSSEVEAVLGPASERLTSALQGIDLSGDLTSALVHVAVCCGREVRVMYDGPSGSKRGLEINHPRLIFKGDWKLGEKGTPGSSARSMSNIHKVEIA